MVVGNYFELNTMDALVGSGVGMVGTDIGAGDGVVGTGIGVGVGLLGEVMLALKLGLLGVALEEWLHNSSK